MLTPKFKLSQTESEVSIIIYAPFARVADTEINIDENIFIFYSSPYYLRLNLPGKLIDSEKEVHKSLYDADKGSYEVTCMKQTFGEFFPGLDMLTDLLTPKGSTSVKQPVMEVLSAEGVDSCENEDAEDDDLEFFFEQKLPEESMSEGFKYGFANLYNNVFSSLTEELSNLVDVKEPDKKPACERKKERLQSEKESFDEDHYLADLYDQDVILPSLHFVPSFHKLKKDDVEYTSVDEESLLKLPRKELLIDKGYKSQVFYGLVDIIFSWCYDHRVTVGETCCESAWNIRKVSATLSWLNTFSNLKEVVLSSMRRSLIFPLMRNFEMSLLVLQDTIQILSLGRKQVLKCLLEIHSMFNNYYEPYYIFNQLYITDYCVWIQTVEEKQLVKLTDALKKISVSKEDLELELPELESAAEMVLQEEKECQNKEENLNELVESLERISVIENAFAVSGNDNDTEEGLIPSVPSFVSNNAVNQQEKIDSDDDSSDEDSSDDSDDSDDSSEDSDDDDDDDDSSSTSSGSADSVRDSDSEADLIVKINPK